MISLNFWRTLHGHIYVNISLGNVGIPPRVSNAPRFWQSTSFTELWRIDRNPFFTKPGYWDIRGLLVRNREYEKLGTQKDGDETCPRFLTSISGAQVEKFSADIEPGNKISLKWNPQTMIICDAYPTRNYVDFLVTKFNSDETTKVPYVAQFVLRLLIVAGIQSLQTLWLHCIELLVNLSRDEAAWRRASHYDLGAYISLEPFVSAALSWENIVLFVAKALLHWFMGQSILVGMTLGTMLMGAEVRLRWKWFIPDYYGILFWVGWFLYSHYTLLSKSLRPATSSIWAYTDPC